MAVSFDQWANQLQAEDEKKKQHAHDFARPALSQPALQPGEDHAGKQDVCQGEGQEHHRRPGKDFRLRESNTYENSEQPQGGHSRCRVQRPVGQANQEVRSVAERETQKSRGLDVFGECRGHQRKELPEQKHGPQQNAEPFRVSLGEQKPGRSAQSHGAADAAAHKSQADENA